MVTTDTYAQPIAAHNKTGPTTISTAEGGNNWLGRVTFS